MSLDLEKATIDISQNREEVIERLVRFSMSDLLLFWGDQKDLMERQSKVWEPIIKWVNDDLETRFESTKSLDVPENTESGYRVRKFLNALTDKELAAFYAAALDMRSVMLATALVKGKINAEQAFEAAFLEETFQAENWGNDEEAAAKREELKKELQEIEKFLRG